MEEVRNRWEMPAKVCVNLCRLVLGLVFVFSGIVKAIDPVGTQIKLEDYLIAFGAGDLFLDSTLLILACVLAGMEFLLGIYMTLGIFVRGTSLLLLIAMCVLTPFTLFTALKNPVEDCGCFGDALILTNWQTFSKNVFLLVVAIYVFLRRKYIIPIVSAKRQWIVTLVMVILIVRFMAGNINGLPVIDFRPYKIGTDLHKEVVMRENPEMMDFFIMDNDLNDLTDQVIDSPGYTFLLVSNHLETIDMSSQDLMDNLFDYCSTYGYAFYGLTSSGSYAVREWQEKTGSELEFLHADEIPLKTIVRSNPGLLLLKDGVLVNKWSGRRIPSEKVLSDSLDRIQVGQIPSTGIDRTPWGVALLFVLPLLLIILIDTIKKKIQ